MHNQSPTAFVEDARAAIERSAGRVYNLGGGPDASLSVWHEFRDTLSELAGAEPVACVKVISVTATTARANVLEAHAELVVHDLQGRAVRRLVSGVRPDWSRQPMTGRPAASAPVLKHLLRTAASASRQAVRGRVLIIAALIILSFASLSGSA